MKIKKHRSRKPYIISAIIVVVLAVITGGLLWRHHHKSIAVVNPTTPQVGENTINYAPATDQEKADSDNIKDQDIKRLQVENNPPTTPPGQKNTITMTITSIDSANNTVTVRGYSSNIFEDGGTCSVVATKGSATVTATSAAFTNANTTDCATQLPRTDFSSSGSWSFVLSYSSAANQGSSASKAYTVN